MSYEKPDLFVLGLGTAAVRGVTDDGSGADHEAAKKATSAEAGGTTDQTTDQFGTSTSGSAYEADE